MYHGRRAWLIVGASLFLLLATVPADGAERLAVTKIAADQISWTPMQNEHGLVLTVAGPGEASFERSFEPGEVASFRAVGGDGKALPDGVYIYELRPSVVVEPEVRREMAAARERGDDSLIAELQAEGKLPRSLNVLTGSFSVERGRLVDRAPPEQVNKDVLHYDDVIITGSLCVGFDCQNGESFGFDTIILKEHNLRIYFNDTSYTASYPTNNWRMTVNDSTNGGASYFSIDDVDDGTSIFKIEAGAPSNSLYVEDYGRVGLGTSTPVVELHIKDSDTPTNRLEQDSSGGWTAQTWDVAGNESNFFIRDATNGSKLPFRIQPGTPSSTLSLKADGNVGIGTWSPEAPLHVTRNLNDASDNIMVVENTTTGAGSARLVLRKTNITPSATNDPTWIFNSNGTLRLSAGTDGAEFELDASGNLKVTGSYRVNGTTLNVPDYVFRPDYNLMPLDELKLFLLENRRLPNVPSAENVSSNGLNMTDMQLLLLQKIEELTLYTIQQQETIEQLKEKVDSLEQDAR